MKMLNRFVEMIFNKQKIQFFLLLILISFLGISIFVLWQKSQMAIVEEEVKVERVIFKENGVTMDKLYASLQSVEDATAKILNQLNILNDDVSFLDGKPLEIDGREKIPLTVMIENYPEVRAYTVGLDKAKIVYEALVEGGITRYLAVFDPNNVSAIGPVRSARPYFIHWAEEFGGIYTHIGGSEEALAYLRNSSGVINVDENEGENIIWRNHDYSAPHNAFTSTKKLYEKAEKYTWNKHLQTNFFKFKLKEYPAQNPLKEISIDFSLPIYHVTWKYSLTENGYERHIAGLKQEGILAKNIIVQVLPNNLIADDEKGRLAMSVLGAGKAFYFLDGEEYEGTWQKLDYSEKTTFLDAENQEMAFNKGQTWIEVVDGEWKMTVR